MATIEREFFSPPEIAKQLGTGHDKILTWIRNGQLKAVDISAACAQRPRYRIHRAELEAFLRGRSTQPAPKSCRKKRAQGVEVKKYF